MDADGVEILHITDGYRRVVGVTDDLVFYFLVALDALLDEHLTDGGEGESVLHLLPQLVCVVGKAAARAAEGEGGAKDNGVAYLFRRFKSLFGAVGYLRGHYRLAYLLAKLLKKLPVLRSLNALGARAEHFNAAFFEHALLCELHCEIQPRLAADAGDYCVRELIAADASEVFERERLHIYLIRDRGVGHYRGGVGVCKDDLVALLFERKARLSARVVKFGSLTYDDGARAYDEHLVYIISFGHGSSPPSYC